MSDHYHSERSGAKYEKQSATEFKFVLMEVRFVTSATRGFFFPFRQAKIAA